MSDVVPRFYLVPFTAEHYLAMKPRQEEAAIQDYKPELVGRLLRSAAAYTLMDGDGSTDVPIVSGGILLYWPGVAELWFHGVQEATQHPVPVFRHSKRLVEQWIKDFNLHRIQLTIDASFLASYRFAEALGFELESRMPKWGPNQEEFLRYVRLP